jgi:hypothetical protein
VFDGASNFQVAVFWRVFEETEGLDFRLSLLALGQTKHQAPDSLSPKESAIRESQRDYLMLAKSAA